MPDEKGNTSGPGVKDTPMDAYKSGRSDDVEEGSLGADTGGAGEQKSRLPEGSDEKGSFQSGGFQGDQDAPNQTVDPPGEGDTSPEADSPGLGSKTGATGGGDQPEPSADPSKLPTR
jgi:hypothetical protein